MTTKKAIKIVKNDIQILESVSGFQINDLPLFDALQHLIDIAQRFEDAISPEGFTLWSADILSEFGYGCLNETELSNYKVYLVPKEKDNV